MGLNSFHVHLGPTLSGNYQGIGSFDRDIAALGCGRNRSGCADEDANAKHDESRYNLLHFYSPIPNDGHLSKTRSLEFIDNVNLKPLQVRIPAV
jgi:hypothetical protein